MRIRRLTQPDPKTGAFEGVVERTFFTNPAGEPIPEIPCLSSLFMFWDNEVEIVDEGESITQSFVVSDVGYAEFASRTLSRLVHAFASLRRSPVDWHSIVHDAEHLAHDRGRLRALVTEGARHGVVTQIRNFLPQRMPSFFD